MKTFDLTFTAQGYFKQRIQITKKGLSPKKLVKLLNQGKAVTTIHMGTALVVMTKTSNKLGEVLSTENNLEYEDFSVDDPLL